MPFKMKGFPMLKGTGAMKAMKESAMKKMHASPKKAMKDPMKKMKDPMKKMKDPMKAMKDPMKAMKDPMKAMHASPKKAMSPKKKMKDKITAEKQTEAVTQKAIGKMAKRSGGKVAKQTPQLGRLKSRLTIKAEGKKAVSPKKKLKAAPPETQAKIKKMIVCGIEKGMDDRDIMKKIRSMTDGSKEYTYNRKTKEVRVYPKGRSGFEGELETDPDKG